MHDICSLDHDQLFELFSAWGQPRFRARQLESWIYGKGVSSFDEMTNLPASLRTRLKERFTIPISRVAARQASKDGTVKYLVAFNDGCSVETVGIPSMDGKRLTVCFSTQAGCAMGCVFCATGQGGFTRNLSAWEMYEQVRVVERDFKKRVSNVVAMGQGEPFANYDAVMRALRLINNPNYINVGARHITVSTCGFLNEIERFAHEPEQFTLAVSLHSAIQTTRDALMPGARHYPLDKLKETLRRYAETTGRRPSLEYALIEKINDTDEQLDALLRFCEGLLVHVNLIPLNPTESDSSPTGLQASKRIGYFEHILSKNKINVSIRSSRGCDIDGACGQLAQHTKTASLDHH